MAITKYYIDLIINDKNSEKLCIPNMTIRNNQITVFDDKTKTKLFKDIQNQLKTEHDTEMEIDDIKQLLKNCDEEAFDIYKGKSIYNPYTARIRHFHLDVKQQLIYKYCSNATYLLDMGSGKNTDAQFWNKARVKNVVGIEPSKESIRFGYERLKKFKQIGPNKTQINVIEGLADEDWVTDKKYEPVLEHKYDAITFQFTIHYMMYNMEIVMKNILKVSKKGTKVVITCMDGQLIHEELHKHNKIEVRRGKEPIFAIFSKYEHLEKELPKRSDILAYFKGTYGVSHGSIEPLVDIKRLIRFFDNNGYTLLGQKKFLDYNSKNKQKMDNCQKKVSSYYTSLVFIRS
jgi:SAM-dependent methyltransferase